MNELKRTKRIRQQTAVLLSAIAEIIKREEKEIANLPDCDVRQRLEKDLAYHRSLLNTTTDQYGTAKAKVKRQGTRLIRAGCPHCGYTIRISSMWINCALPVCPNPDCDHKGKPFEVDEIPPNTEYAQFEPLKKEPAKKIEITHDPDFDRMVRESEGWLDETK